MKFIFFKIMIMIIVLTFELWGMFFLISCLFKGIHYLFKSDFLLSISNFSYINIFDIMNTHGDWNLAALLFWTIDVVLILIGCTIMNVINHEIDK